MNIHEPSCYLPTILFRFLQRSNQKLCFFSLLISECLDFRWMTTHIFLWSSIFPLVSKLFFQRCRLRPSRSAFPGLCWPEKHVLKFNFWIFASKEKNLNNLAGTLNMAALYLLSVSQFFIFCAGNVVFIYKKPHQKLRFFWPLPMEWLTLIICGTFSNYCSLSKLFNFWWLHSKSDPSTVLESVNISNFCFLKSSKYAGSLLLWRILGFFLKICQH